MKQGSSGVRRDHRLYERARQSTRRLVSVVPSHLYSLSWAPNPNSERTFSSGEALRVYLRGPERRAADEIRTAPLQTLIWDSRGELAQDGRQGRYLRPVERSRIIGTHTSPTFGGKSIPKSESAGRAQGPTVSTQDDESPVADDEWQFGNANDGGDSDTGPPSYGASGRSQNRDLSLAKDCDRGRTIAVSRIGHLFLTRKPGACCASRATPTSGSCRF